ncbi:MAG: RES domain-containing protein [Prevotellaceae bacterium]|nr:RES domain-containing protein [Candidatus Faecinaster equi]
MNEESPFRALVDNSSKFAESIKVLNQRLISLSSGLDMLQLQQSIQSIRDALPDPPVIQMDESLFADLRALTNDYTKVINHASLSDLKDRIIPMQMSCVMELSMYSRSLMIDEIMKCFASAEYTSLVSAINSSLTQTSLMASDIAYLKTSELVKNVKKSLILPKGMLTSLKEMHVKTANTIASDIELQYDTKENCFVSSAGQADSRSLNIICSGQKVFQLAGDEEFSANELTNFATYLSQTPTLAKDTETGQRIYNLLARLFSEGEHMIGFDADLFFHSRARDIGVMPYTYDEMTKAPHGLPGAGRYNHPGIACYYFANTQHGAEVEVKKHKKDGQTVQTAMIQPCKQVKMLDLSNTIEYAKTFLRFIRFEVSDSSVQVPREYLIPCFVSDCCKRIGYDGIKYYGSREYSNYVTWSDGYFSCVGMCDEEKD